MGVERSGHYFFKEFSYQDSGVLALLKLVKVLAVKKKPLSKLIAPYKKYITLPEINFAFVEGSEQEVLQLVGSVFSGGRASRTDGLTVEYKDWWFNLRRSGTEDLWRLSIEGDTEELTEIKRKQIERIIKNVSKEDKKAA